MEPSASDHRFDDRPGAHDGSAPRGTSGARPSRTRTCRGRRGVDLRQPAAVRPVRGSRPVSAHPRCRPRALRRPGRRRRLCADGSQHVSGGIRHRSGARSTGTPARGCPSSGALQWCRDGGDQTARRSAARHRRVRPQGRPTTRDRPASDRRPRPRGPDRGGPDAARARWAGDVEPERPARHRGTAGGGADPVGARRGAGRRPIGRGLSPDGRGPRCRPSRCPATA